MNTFKLIPQFRENCIIQGKKEWIAEINVGDTIFLMKKTPTKKYSIISKVDAIEDSEEALIYIDERILGSFIKDEEVSILKYYPAEALEIHISISTEYGIITKGDWTSVILPSLKGKLIDYGRDVTFIIPWKGGAPIIVTGIINLTLPNPPVIIGDNTHIIVDKISDEKILEIRRQKLKTQEERVEILEAQIKNEQIESIRQLKHNNFPHKGQIYEFKATNPKKIFASIKNIFKGLDVIEEPTEETFDDEQDYLATAVFKKGQDTDSTQLIDIQVAGSENSGKLIINITGKNDDIISEALSLYASQISDLKQGLEQKITIIKNECPGCGAPLPVEDIDINGIVKCKHCRNISKIPKILRY